MLSFYICSYYLVHVGDTFLLISDLFIVLMVFCVTLIFFLLYEQKSKIRMKVKLKINLFTYFVLLYF